MKIAIMQPYLFPYIGYFQLINSVDYFGIGDDVQFIKDGWIQRNRFLINHNPSMFTFPVRKDSSKKEIKERFFNDSFENDKKKFLRILNSNYKKAPFYKEVVQLVENIFEFKETNISKFNINQLRIICDYMSIETPFLESSLWKIENHTEFDVQKRVIEKLKKLSDLGVNHFVNPIGGKQLYHKEFFKENKFELSFLKSNETVYKQFRQNFSPNLSIIDVLMFNDLQFIKDKLNNFELI